MGPVRGNELRFIQGTRKAASAVPTGRIQRSSGGRMWDPLFAQGTMTACLQQRMEDHSTAVYQNVQGHRTVAYVREHFFGAVRNSSEYGQGLSMRRNLGSSTAADTIRTGLRLPVFRGRINHKDQPTVITGKDHQGYGTGTGQGQKHAHNTKKVDIGALKGKFRDRFDIPVKCNKDPGKLPFFSRKKAVPSTSIACHAVKH